MSSRDRCALSGCAVVIGCIPLPVFCFSRSFTMSQSPTQTPHSTEVATPPTPPRQPSPQEPEYESAKGCLLISLAFVALFLLTVAGIALSRYLE